MNRTLLTVGNQITFDEIPIQPFEIREVIGRGSTCVVYRAVCEDNTEHLLKEFYPKHLKIVRNVTGKIEVCEEEKDLFNKERERFRLGHENQRNIRYATEGLKNATCNVQAIYHANGTEYIDMTCFAGRTYDKVREESVYNLMRRMRALAKVVRNYHVAGLLHLDIKPENIYVLPEQETCEMVMMFDFDSIVKKQDVLSSPSLYYTKNWAAPEQILQENRSSICEATDIFSIGEMLFFQLFGRHSTASERSSFAKYKFDVNAEIFKNINPKAFSLLSVLLHKTICLDVKKRYQTAEDLIEQLDKIIEVANPKEPYLKSNCPIPIGFFVGRDKDMEQIHQSLQNNPILFLSGIGGIGKSELAKQYAKKYRSNYESIIFVYYASNVVSLVINDNAFPIHNFYQYTNEKSEEYYVRKLRKLKSLCNDRTLLIVDNFNTLLDSKLSELLSLGCKTLITTRRDFSEYGYTQHKVNSLSSRDTIRQIFDVYYTRMLIQEESDNVETLIDLVAGHTMMVELLAKQMMASRILPSEMLEKLREHVVSENGKEKIDIGKDECLAISSAYEYIEALFNVSELGSKELQVLVNLSLIPSEGIACQLFYEWCELDSYNEINALVKAGWIRLDGADCISLHPVIRNVVLKKLENNCESINRLLINSVNFAYKQNSISEYRRVAGIIYEIAYCLLYSNVETLVVADFQEDASIICSNYFDLKQLVEGVQKSIDIKHKLLEKNDISIADAYHYLGKVLQKQGKSELAEEYYIQELERVKDLYGEAHTRVSMCYNHLGSIYIDLHKYQEAERILNKALEVNLSLGNTNNLLLAKIYNNLGAVRQRYHDFEGALEKYTQVMNICREIGEEGDSTLTTVYEHMGMIYRTQGRFEEAERSFQRALELSEALYKKEESIDISNSYRLLGNLYKVEKEYQKSELFLKKALAVDIKLCGENSICVAGVYNDIGTLYHEQSKLGEAEDYYRKALKIYNNLQLKNHLITGESLYNIGIVCLRQGKVEEAEKYYCQAIDMDLNQSDGTDVGRLELYAVIGEMYAERQEYEKMEVFYAKVLEIYKKSRNSLKMAEAYGFLGASCMEQGKYAEAEKHYIEAIKLCKKLNLERDESVAKLMYNLAGSCYMQNKRDAAKEYYRKALDIYTNYYSDSNNMIALIYQHLSELQTGIRSRISKLLSKLYVE